jgi:hypothetical protein
MDKKWKFQIPKSKFQISTSVQNSKSQTKSFWSFGHWSLEFIWNLEFVIRDLNNSFGLLNGISSQDVLAVF